MFEKLAVQYYEEDELSDLLVNDIRACMLRAEAVLKKEFIAIIGDNHFFHDWYVTSFKIFCENNIMNCQLEIAKGEIKYGLYFDGGISMALYGEIISSTADYPPRTQGDSFAQVLDFWIDYIDCYKVCILLDNERYIILKAKKIIM